MDSTAKTQGELDDFRALSDKIDGVKQHLDRLAEDDRVTYQNRMDALRKDCEELCVKLRQLRESIEAVGRGSEERGQAEGLTEHPH